MMKPHKDLIVYNMLVSLIKDEDDSVAQIRAMEDEVWIDWSYSTLVY